MKYLFAGAAASLLIAGAALAQDGGATDTTTGPAGAPVTQSAPATVEPATDPADAAAHRAAEKAEKARDRAAPADPDAKGDGAHTEGHTPEGPASTGN
jgi:hypothetical protein